jgi:glutamate decarboxylase
MARPNDKFRDEMEGDLYSRRVLEGGLPRSHFPVDETDPRAIYAAVHDELMRDGNSRQNLATFCQTWVEPEMHQLMNE